MLKYFLTGLLLFLLSAYSPNTAAQMDPRLKTIVFMSGFGTMGGALLGMASKAFNNSDSFGRAVTKGASLGLYAGILFSSYIILSHHLKKNRLENEQSPYPYEGTSVHESGDEMENPPYPYDDGRLRFREPWGFENPSYGMEKPIRVLPLFYFKILQFQF